MGRRGNGVMRHTRMKRAFAKCKHAALALAGAAAVTGLTAGGITAGAGAADLDLTTPDGAIAAMRKIQCSLTDNEPIFYTWEGEVFSRRAGEPDKKLFRVAGMNVRTCASLDGGQRGTGNRMVSREVMLYLDPKTGAVLDTWRNPWLDKDVNVLHVLNDPVNGRPNFPYAEDGTPSYRWFGREQDGEWFMSITVPLFYHNELGGEYQRYVGGAYHATEMFNFMGNIDALTDGDTTSSPAKVGWVRISHWLPWMEMQGREGDLYVHASGQKIAGFDALPEVLKTFIDNRAPLYKTPPPADDKRPNETSWTYFKKHVDGERLPRGGAN